METSETADGSSTITSWTLIVRAQGFGPNASKALGELLEKFRPFIIWRIGARPPLPGTTPEDLYQEFALGFIRRNEVLRLQQYGSLRGWLKVAIKNFLNNKWDAIYCRPQFTDVAVEHSAVLTESQIDAAYVGTLVMRALELARSRTSDPDRFAKISRFLPGPQCDFTPYTEISKGLGISEGAARVAVHAERQRYQQCVNEIVFQTLDISDAANDPERARQLLQEEKQALLRALDPPAEVVSFDPDREAG